MEFSMKKLCTLITMCLSLAFFSSHVAHAKKDKKKENKLTVPTTKKKKKQKQKKKEKAKKTEKSCCPICREDCKKGESIFEHCNEMHIRCLWGWIKDKEKPTCPLCVKEFDKKSIKTITQAGEKLKTKINKKIATAVKEKHLKKVKGLLKATAEKIFVPLSYLLEESTAQEIFSFLVEQKDFKEAFSFLQDCRENCKNAKTETWKTFFNWFAKNKKLFEDLQQDVFKAFFIKAAQVDNTIFITLILNDAKLYEKLEKKDIVDAFVSALGGGSFASIQRFMNREKETILGFRVINEQNMMNTMMQTILNQLATGRMPNSGVIRITPQESPIVSFALMQSMSNNEHQALSNTIDLIIKHASIKKLCSKDQRVDAFVYAAENNLTSVVKAILKYYPFRKELEKKDLQKALRESLLKGNVAIIQELFNYLNTRRTLLEDKDFVHVILGCAH